MDDKSSPKGVWSGHVNHLNFAGHQRYLWNGWSWSGQILYTGRLCQVQAHGWQITLRRGVVKVTWSILNFAAPMISLERLKLESLNFAHR